MDYVIDIQGFRDFEDHFLLKEAAVIAIDHHYVGHWIVAPPHSFKDLGIKARSQNNWLSCYFHGLEWFDGYVPYKQIGTILREVTRTAQRIYTRGREKADFIQELTARQVINLEDVSCPSFKQLPDDRSYCFHHGVTKGGIYVCALNNAMKLKLWILSQVAAGTSRPAQYTTPRQPFLMLPADPPDVVTTTAAVVEPVYKNGQSTSTAGSQTATCSDDGCSSCRPNPRGVDATNSLGR